MSIWETIKSWFACGSTTLTLDDVFNRPMEISEQKFLELTDKANSGDAESQLFVGVLYLKGVKIPQNAAKALEYLEKSAQASNTQAQKILAKEYMSGTVIPQNLQKSFEWTQKLAYGGDVEATYDLGLMYEEGQFVEKDIHKAIECLQKAADLGYIEAKVEIADIYFEGTDVPMDRTRACILYKEVLAGNNPGTIDVGQINMCLGQAYAEKQFYPCGLAEGEGFIYLKNAAEQGYYGAMRIFAMIMEDTADEGFRTWLFEFASQHQDNPHCAFALGICYERGYRVIIDINSAFNYYKKSADLGDPWGKHFTACSYLSGKGVEKSVDEWLRLETQAAEEGVPPAQYNLGVCYLKGDHVAKDPVKAEKLLKAAAAKHYDAAVKALNEIQSFETEEKEALAQVHQAAETPKEGSTQVQQKASETSKGESTPQNPTLPVASSTEDTTKQVQIKPAIFRIEHQEDFHN